MQWQLPASPHQPYGRTASGCPLSPFTDFTNKEKRIMSTVTTAATEYRNLPLSILMESKTSPRRIFEDEALKELADFVALIVLWPRTPRGAWQ
jgi:hypothetical protein